MTEVLHAGRLQHFYDCWLRLTDNLTILSWIRYGFPIPFAKQPRQFIVPTNTFSPSEKDEMSKAINKLLNLGAIVRCKPCNGQFISKIFLAPKPNGGKRFILNLKPLNKFVQKIHFKMEDYRTAAKLLPRHGYTATIDLKEAYLLVPISEPDRKFLRFEFQHENGINTTYQFTAMPYGLSVAPRTFTKLMKEVVTSLRSQGFTSVIYLDDILCIGDSYLDCLENVTETLRLLKCLGFVINSEKSSLQPNHSCRFLGFIFNSIDMSISLPDDKRDHIAFLVKKFISLPTCSIRDFAQLIGTLVAACPAARYGWLYTKFLERQKFLEFKKHRNYDAKIELTGEILPDLKWWYENISLTRNFIDIFNYDLEIYTDASRTGWGAFCNQRRVNGGWTDSEKEFHINYLELLAIFLALKCLVAEKSNIAILLRVDNTTAISYINRMGGIQFPHLNELARTIWQWCEKRGLWLSASYINSRDNKEADEESRRNPDIEWDLSLRAFEFITNNFGIPEIDLFASRINAKCNIYVSWKQDPDAAAVDAFTLNWKQWFFYAFPPFPLILKCIQKIKHDRASGILVFPFWPSQPWFPLLKTLLVSEIVYLDSSYALSNSCFRAHHKFFRQNTLAVAKLSGLRSLEEELQSRP